VVPKLGYFGKQTRHAQKIPYVVLEKDGDQLNPWCEKRECSTQGEEESRRYNEREEG
jgi:hypothetical protein